MKDLTFSIMIMSHNSPGLLRTCIEALRKHTPFPFDLIIVDDASEPPYQIEDAVVVRMPKRSDCCNLRNVGMAMAKTDYVFWIDNDCVVGEKWYEPLLEVIYEDDKVGLTGQPMDARLVRNPFFPINQSDCMIEYQFAYDYDHNTRLCDYITSYCVLVKREAFRPTYCFGMPTPMLDPELGAHIKMNGYKVKVANRNCRVTHYGSGTVREGGTDYHYKLAENFAKWFRFWKPHAKTVFELYGDRDISHQHNANEPLRESSRNQHGDKDKGPDITE